MIAFKSNKKIETAFKNATLCYADKNEGEIISEGMLELFKELEPLKDKINYLINKTNEKFEGVFTIASIIYPDLNTKEAIEKFYNDLKKVDEKFEGIEEKPINKNIRTKKEIEDLITKASFAKTIIAKAYYIKEAIRAEECAIF